MRMPERAVGRSWGGGKWEGRVEACGGSGRKVCS